MKKLQLIGRMILPFIMLIPMTVFSQNCATQIGSVSFVRGNCFTLDGACLSNTPLKLADPANFGSAGIVHYANEISHESGILDSATLAAYDVFFIGYFRDGTFSTAELDAMYEFVENGGRMLITGDNSRFDQVVAYFGHPTTTQGPVPNFPEVGQENHPVFDGPFGLVTTYNAAASRGFFTTTVGATVIGRDANGGATLLEKNIGSGRVILGSDVCVFGNATGTPGSAITNNNDIVMANAFAYLADVPTALSADAGSCQTVYYGYAPLSCADLTATGLDGAPPYSYTWSTGATTASINVCPTESTDYTVDVVDANGCTASASVTVGVVDVRCGKKLNKVAICHNGNSICISANAIPSHLNNHGGDQLGACGQADPCAAPGALIGHQGGSHTHHEAALNAWPNPVENKLTVDIDLIEEISTSIELISMDGKVQYSFSTNASNTFEIDMSSYASGIYILRAHNSISTELLRIVK